MWITIKSLWKEPKSKRREHVRLSERTRDKSQNWFSLYGLKYRYKRPKKMFKVQQHKEVIECWGKHKHLPPLYISHFVQIIIAMLRATVFLSFFYNCDYVMNVHRGI